MSKILLWLLKAPQRLDKIFLHFPVLDESG